MKHFGCFAHTINLIVQDGIAEISDLTEKVRKIVSHFRRSSTAQTKLYLYQKNVQREQQKLILDVVTRWNSTYYMLSRFFQLKDAVRSTVALLDKELPIVSSDEWLAIEEVINILKPFEQITNILSGEKYVTGSLVIVFSNGLKNVMEKICSKGTKVPQIASLCLTLQKGLKNQLQNFEKSKTLIVSTMLDPRFKSISFESEIAAVIGKDFIINAISNKLAKEAQEQEKTMHQHHSDDFHVGQTEDPDSTINVDIWSFHDARAAAVRPIEGTFRSKAIIEFNRYNEDEILKRHMDPLMWWKANRHNYPNLSEVVRDLFCTVGTSVPCQRYKNVQKNKKINLK